MAAQSNSDRYLTDLLRLSLADPFENYDDFHARDWFRAIRDRFPLMSFRAERYAALQEFELPTVEPLPVFVESILRDEGCAPGAYMLEPMDALLDRRRADLGRNEQWFEHVDEDGGPRLSYGSPSFTPGFDLAGYEVVDDDGGFGYVSPYEDVGRELTDLKSAYQRARTKRERKVASDEIRDFLRRLGIQLPPGRRPIGMPEELLSQIVDEATALIRLAIEAPAPELTTRAHHIFENAGIPEAERGEWAARLTFPMFSARELQVIRGISAEDLRRRPATAKRLAAHLLAHRLGIESRALLRRVFGSGQAAAYAEEGNPFDGL